MSNTVYGDISARTAAFVTKEMLERGFPWMIFEKFGQAKPLPANNTKSMQFRRYFLESGTFSLNSVDTYNPEDYFAHNNFDPAQKTLTEGVTPTATKLSSEDYQVTLIQYGDLITLTDIIEDTHEDPVMQEATDILGEQAAIIMEKVRFNALVAGTNVVYSNDAARASVNTKFSKSVHNKVVRLLKRQLAKPITKIVKSTPAYGTKAIAPAFIAVCHPDLEYDISAVGSFVAAEDYGTISPWEGEFGKIGEVRYLSSTICEPWTGVGLCGASGGENIIENASGEAHVYPIIYLARDAYAMVPFKGKNAVVPMVTNRKPTDSDPLAQRTHVGWKAMSACIILNDAWLCRAEVACTDNDHLS